MMTLSCVASASTVSTSQSASAKSLRASAFLPARPALHQGLLGRPQRTQRCLQFQVEAKGKRRNMQQIAQEPPTPPVDPDNVEFVIFVRSAVVKRWFPLSVMKGGSPANMLVKSLDSNLGKNLFEKTLVRNIAQAIYKDKEEVIKQLREQAPGMKHVKEFEFGFKIRDKANPKSWYVPEGVQLLPEEDEIEASPLEKAKDAVGSFTSKLPKLPGLPKLGS